MLPFAVSLDSSPLICIQVGAGWVGKREYGASFPRPCLCVVHQTRMCWRLCRPLTSFFACPCVRSALGALPGPDREAEEPSHDPRGGQGRLGSDLRFHGRHQAFQRSRSGCWRGEERSPPFSTSGFLLSKPQEVGALARASLTGSASNVDSGPDVTFGRFNKSFRRSDVRSKRGCVCQTRVPFQGRVLTSLASL